MLGYPDQHHLENGVHRPERDKGRLRTGILRTVDKLHPLSASAYHKAYGNYAQTHGPHHRIYYHRYDKYIADL